MTLRTPRRRISPRTKRRYKAIREFFKRALGSSSQQDIKINSSIAVNVTDLKHKILGIENQLTEVSKHCRDLVCLENSFRKETDNFATDVKHNICTINEQTEGSSGKRTKSSDTKVLYKNAEIPYRKSDESDYATLEYSTSNDKKNKTPPNNMYPEYHNVKATKTNKERNKVVDRMEVPYECDPGLRKHRAQSAFDNIASVYSTSSYRSLGPEHDSPHINSAYTKHRHGKKHSKRRENEHTPVEPSRAEPRPITNKEYNKRKPESPPRYQEEKRRSRKNKRGKTRIDQDFIADIIKKQYKPVKLFGRRDSEISQFSAPVCRDQEFSIHEDIQEGEELCSCCFDEHNRTMYGRNHDLSDMRSICDTRLYSIKRNSRKHHRRHADIYNDAALYDLIPVKEKSSPKSRRKFAEDHMMGYNYYKEVPPSPRTLRPRLNLKAQYYTEYDDYMVQMKPNRRYKQLRPKRQDNFETLESDITSEIVLPRNRREKQKFQKSIKVHNLAPIQQDIGTISSLHSPTFGNDHNNVTLNLNKTQESDASDKTDKALCEIKDILQCFLQEIKKEATQPACDNTMDINNKTTQKHSSGLQQNSPINTGVILDSGHSNFFNQSVPQCGIAPSFMPPFQNPCCYPILSMCPMNCMQNGYIVPSPSLTCHACAATTKETVCQDCSKNKMASNDVCSIQPNETDELIKEIYKFVAQSPKSAYKKRDDGNKSQKKEVNSPRGKELTSRSVGASSRMSKHDAQVGTPTTKCYSRSCEAIGSRIITDTSYTTTQSDTVLEKLSLEITQSDSEISSDSTVLEKRKKGKFSKVLQSIGLLKKKKKKDVIEEMSESESSVELKIKPKPPFRQEVLNYAMHGQEYFHPPPISPYPHPEGPYGYGPPPGYDPRAYYPNQMPPPNKTCTHHRAHHQDTIPEHSPSRYQPERHSYPSAPPYPNYEPHCSHQQPQVPLCLKEIEVKSTGTQSERKTSFFQKLAKRPVTATARSDPIKNCSTQTPQMNNNKPEKPGLFTGWKNLQAKGDANSPRKFLFKNPKGNANTDTMKFSFNTQKQLAQGDMKMRNAMLKKLFYKRNPFSPRNLIVRTILGKDQASYGEPQMTFKPRLFF